MKSVLIFPCGSEIAREVFESLNTNKEYYLYGGSSVKDKGEYLNYDSIIENIPFITDSNFIEALKQILNQYSIDYIFPCHDDVSLVLSQHQSELSPATVVTHDYRVNDICRNKDKTYEVFKTYPFTPQAAYEIFPLFVKPKNSNGSKGAVLINDQNQLDNYYREYDINNTLELEYLPGSEYTVDCFSKQGQLMFCGARERLTTKMGIAEISTRVHDTAIDSIANSINNQILTETQVGFNGAWFFQLKKDNTGAYKLLEIGARVSGGMSFYRMEGINFSELSILTANNVECELYSGPKPILKGFSKFFTPKYKYQIGHYDSIYVDFDDTLYYHKTNSLNTTLIKYLYQELNQNKRLILITRSKNDFKQILEKYRILNLFDNIIHITDNTPKKDLIAHQSVFIDDSFSERNFIKDQVYCFGLDNYTLLIQD
jgi:hypothetical protein